MSRWLNHAGAPVADIGVQVQAQRVTEVAGPFDELAAQAQTSRRPTRNDHGAQCPGGAGLEPGEHVVLDDGAHGCHNRHTLVSEARKVREPATSPTMGKPRGTENLTGCVALASVIAALAVPLAVEPGLEGIGGITAAADACALAGDEADGAGEEDDLSSTQDRDLGQGGEAIGHIILEAQGKSRHWLART